MSYLFLLIQKKVFIINTFFVVGILNLYLIINYPNKFHNAYVCIVYDEYNVKNVGFIKREVLPTVKAVWHRKIWHLNYVKCVLYFAAQV